MFFSSVVSHLPFPSAVVMFTALHQGSSEGRGGLADSKNASFFQVSRSALKGLACTKTLVCLDLLLNFRMILTT